MSRETALASAQAAKLLLPGVPTGRSAPGALSLPGPSGGRSVLHGCPLYLARKLAQKELARNRELDNNKQPPPGQGALFANLISEAPESPATSRPAYFAGGGPASGISPAA